MSKTAFFYRSDNAKLDMNHKIEFRILVLFMAFLISSAIVSALPNPASVNCVEKGNKLEIREGTGGQYGVCIFPDGKECEEWAYFRGECTHEQEPGAFNPKLIWIVAGLVIIILAAYWWFFKKGKERKRTR